MYRITVARVEDKDAADRTIYEQLVDDMDLKLFIDAINTPPKPKRMRRKRGAAAEAGK